MSAVLRRAGVVLTAGSFGLALAADASAAPVACGSKITQSTTLTADVGPCNKGGLVVAADNITLDLGGKTVSGKPRVGDGVGITVDGRTGVTITNGTVRDFDSGVVIHGGGGNTVSDVLARDNIGPAKFNSKFGLGEGIAVFSSSDNVIATNTALHNGPFAGITVLADTAGQMPSNNNVIQGNTVVANNVASGGVRQDDGIRIEGPNAVGTQIIGNVVRNNGLDGIAVFADQGTGFKNSGTVISNNEITGNGFHDAGHRKGDGIVLFGSPTNAAIGGADNSQVMDNVVRANAANGIRVVSKSNLITGNTALDNAAWPGLTSAFDLSDLNAACDNNVWTLNVFGTANLACIS